VTRATPVAGDGIVGIGVADIVRQGLNASVLDEIVINLVPVLLGEGIRTVAGWSTAARGYGCEPPRTRNGVATPKIRAAIVSVRIMLNPWATAR
jgi:hypothetical protein